MKVGRKSTLIDQTVSGWLVESIVEHSDGRRRYLLKCNKCSHTRELNPGSFYIKLGPASCPCQPDTPRSRSTTVHKSSNTWNWDAFASFVNDPTDTLGEKLDIATEMGVGSGSTTNESQLIERPL